MTLILLSSWYSARICILAEYHCHLKLLIITLMISIIISPAKFLSAGLNGISAWAFCVLPTVLPFMILSQLLLSTGWVEKICSPLASPFKKIYNTSSYSPYVFLVSIVSGYPIGSKMIADLYEQGKISRNLLSP